MEPSNLENIGSVTPYRSTRSRGSTVNSALQNDSPTTSGKGRITRGKSKAFEKHVSTPMPSRTKGSQSLKNVTVSLTKLKSKLLSVDVEENVIREEGDNAELKQGDIFDKEKLQSTEVVQNGLKEDMISDNAPDHLNDEAETSISKVIDQSNGTGTLNSKKTSDGTDSVEEPIDLDTQHSITTSNLPDPVDSLKSEFDVELIESISAQVESATEVVINETAKADTSTLFYTLMGSSNEGSPQILEKFPSTSTNYVKELPTVNPSEFDAYASSDSQLNNQSGSFSNNQNHIPIQSTKPSIRQDNEIEQSVEDDKRNRSLMFSDDDAEKAIQKDSMEVTGIIENIISVGDMSSCSQVDNVEQSEMSFTVSETSINFLAGTRSDSNINQKTEHKTQSTSRIEILDTSEKDVSQELENLETKPRKILRAKRRSDVMAVSKEVKKRMSLDPNVKLSSGQMKKHDVSDDAQTSKVENVEDSAKCQLKHHSKIGNANEYDASTELENMSAGKMKKTSKVLSDSATMSRSKCDFERMSLHPITLIKSTDSKTASTMNNVDLNDNTETMEVDQFLDSAETSKKRTSSDSKDETSQQLKDKQERKLKAKRDGNQVKEAILTAVQHCKKSKEIPEEDTSKAIQKANRNTTESQIITTKLSKRDLKRKVDTSNDEDNTLIMKPETKKRKMLQSLETSTPKIVIKRMEQNSTHRIRDKLNLKRNLRRTVGMKKVVSKTQWTTAGAFTVTKIPTNKNFDVSLMSTSQFTVTSLSGRNFSFSSYKDGSALHFQP